MTDELLNRAEPFLNVCGSCDYGIGSCSCPAGDYRPVMLDLYRQAEQAQKARDEIRMLHTDSVAGFCPSCYRAQDVSDTDDGLVAWPCPTLRALGFTEASFR